MDKFQKDNNLMTGKGETEEVSWITVNGAHIPIEEGESKREAIAKQFKDKAEQQSHLDKKIEQLLKWQREIPDNVLDEHPLSKDIFRPDVKIPKEKLKELSMKLQAQEPITLEINGRKITAAFDKYGADKNIYYRGKEPNIIEGYYYKLNHIDEVPQVIKSSKFSGQSDETGKDNRAHKGVKVWYYFKTKITTPTGKYDVVINVRDKGAKQYFYDLVYAKKL